VTFRFVCAVLLLCGCTQRAAPPSVDTAQPAFPDLSGRAVIVLPVQAATPVVSSTPGAIAAPLDADSRATLEAELTFWLGQAAPRVRWIAPADVERAAQRARVLEVHPRELPVQDFLRTKLESIGDPLYGELRKLGALLDVRPALLPIGAVFVRESDGSGRVHLLAALIDTTGGRVFWQGIVAGEPGARADATTIASAAEALARLAAR
jgi:hypothetical protein